MINGDVLVIGRNVDETREISRVVGGALGLGLLPAFCFWLLAGAWLSVRAQRRVEDVNLRVQRIIAGDLRERLPHRNIDEPFSRLAAIVNGMLDELETTIHALAGVGNDIAHDLRTPLTRARLTLERGRTNATSLEQLQEAADKAIAGIDQSLSIVTALLRLAEIENSRRSSAFGNVELGEMLREVCDMYEPIAEDKQIALSVGTSATLDVRGDRDLLLEAVANLVDNAIKFTPRSGSVKLELLRGEGETILRVTDTGPGISDQEQEAVLRRFYRSDKIRNTPGVGLGLNLVSAIVKLHGFRLIIHSGPGGRVEIICPDEHVNPTYRRAVRVKVIHAGGRRAWRRTRGECGHGARRWCRPARFPFHYSFASPKAACLPSCRPASARRHSVRPDSGNKMRKLPAPEWLPERKRALLPSSTAVLRLRLS